MSLQKTQLRIDGKTTYKQEFVTCGGVALDEVDFKTMQSKRVPGLFFAGVILNIDGVTGGFNFQNDCKNNISTLIVFQHWNQMLLNLLSKLSELFIMSDAKVINLA